MSLGVPGPVKGFTAGGVSMMTQQRTKKQEETERLHAKTFGAWVNVTLRRQGIQVTDLGKDLRSGVVLLRLLEVLTKESIPSGWVKEPKNDFQCLENVSLALKWLQRHRKINVNPNDVVHGNLKVILSMLWRLILGFQVTQRHDDDGAVAAAGGTDGGDAAPKKRVTTAAAQAREAKERLLRWVRNKTDGYAGVDVTDFENSFRDGLALCALVHQYDDLLLDFESLDPTDARGNLELAMRLANEHMMIPPLVDPDDLLNEDPDARPDDQCVMTYLSEFPRAFVEKSLMEEDDEDESDGDNAEGSAGGDDDAGPPPSEPPPTPEDYMDAGKAIEEAERARAAAEAAAEAAKAEAEARTAQAEAHAEAKAEAKRAAEIAQAQAVAAAAQREAERARAEAEAMKERAAAAEAAAEADAKTPATPGGVSKLVVEVIEGRDLIKCDFLTGKSDPYVVVTLERQKEKTKKCRSSLTPTWNARFDMYFSEKTAQLKFTVFDWDRFWTDEFMGHISINPWELPVGQMVDKWYSLRPKRHGEKMSGEIRVRMTRL